MAFQFSLAARNAALDAIETAIGTAPTLEIRSGAAPADCAAADSGTLLASVVLPSDWLAAGSAGAKTIAGGPWTGNASATGTAAHFRIKKSGTCHLQGSVGVSGADMIVDNASFASGQQFNVTAFTLNAGGA